jgi:hypothetical protein
MLETDKPNYVKPDSGCRQATKFLGRPSRCGECPFEECVFISRKGSRKRRSRRNEQILGLFWGGAEVPELAERFRLSKSSIYGIIAGEIKRGRGI